jgi:chromosome segregation ATPase
VSTLQERLTAHFAALAENRDIDSARSAANELVSVFVTREQGMEEELQPLRSFLLDTITDAQQAALEARRKMHDELTRRIEGLDQRLDGVERGLEGLDQRLDRLEQQAAEATEERREITGRLDGIDQRLDRLEQQAAEATEERREITGRLDGIDQRLDGIDRRLDDAAKDRARIERELGDRIERAVASVKDDIRHELRAFSEAMTIFHDGVNRRLAQMTWVVGILFGTLSLIMTFRG